MKTRSNMPLFVVACSNVKQLTDEQINMLRCGDWLVKRDASGEHAYKVTFKSDTGMCITYHDAYCVETQSYDKVDGNWVYNSEDKTIIAEPLFENIVDKDGHNRFIEIDGVGLSQEGVTIDYCKASLSGTHLLLVVALSVANETTIGNGIDFANFTLPKWIYDKIKPVWSSVYVDVKQVFFRDNTWSTQQVNAGLYLKSNNRIAINNSSSAITINTDRKVRMSFDLLIDNE